MTTDQQETTTGSPLDGKAEHRSAEPDSKSNSRESQQQSNWRPDSRVGRALLLPTSIVIWVGLLLVIIWSLLVFVIDAVPIPPDRFVEGIAAIVAGIAAGLSTVTSREVQEAQRTRQERLHDLTLQQQSAEHGLQLERAKKQRKLELWQEEVRAKREARDSIATEISVINGHLNNISCVMTYRDYCLDADRILRDRRPSADESEEPSDGQNEGVEMPVITIPAKLRPIVGLAAVPQDPDM